MAKINTLLFGELALLPCPSEVPIRETLEFLTDVMISHNGTEKRISLRSKARQFFDYKIPTQAWDMAASFNTSYGAIRKRWAVPIWTESQYIGNVAENATSINCDTSVYDIRPDSLVMLFASSEIWQILEVSTISNGLININSQVKAIDGAWLIPVRLGWIGGNIEKPTNGHNGRTEITFEIEDNPFISTTVPEQYEGDDIYYEPGLLNGGNVSRSIEKRLDFADFALGPVARRSPWLYSRFVTPHRVVLEGPQNTRKFKEWIFRRAGKFRQFWQPTFEVNMRVKNTGVVASILVVESDSYLAYVSERTNVAIQTLNGAWFVRKLSNPIQLNENSIQLTLSSPLNVAASNIARVSFLGLNRLEGDRLEFNWLGNNVVECEVRILELKP